MQQLFSVHKGRTNRATFFIGSIFFGLVISAFPLLLDLSKTTTKDSLYGLLLILVIFVLELYFVYLGLALWIRRLHDINRSGWWLLIAFLPIMNLIFLAYLIYKPSDKGKNKYGDKPHSVLV